MEQLHEKSVTQLAPLLKNKELSPIELTEAVLAVAEASQPTINSYISIDREEALQAAKQAENDIANGHYKGLFHGIPMALKDNIFMQNKVTSMASKIHQQFIPNHDAAVVEKLRQAGVIFTGKLNMHEYAWGITSDSPHFGAVHNPWDTSKIAGGSSGGSGAAVAIGATIASLGTDTAGSIRIPSAACGVVGLKPTFGRVSSYGSFPLAASMDHIGPITKTVTDAAALLEIIAGVDARDANCANVPVENYVDQLTGDVKDLVIGINEEFYFNNIDQDVEIAVRQQIQQLVDRGARVENIQLPTLNFAEAALFGTIISESYTLHHDNKEKRPEDFGPDIQGLFQNIPTPSAVDYLQAQQLRRQLLQDFNRAFEKVDVIITPTLPTVANEIGNDFVTINGEQVDVTSAMMRFTGPSNLTGLPSLTVPAGFKHDLPIGIQIIGPAFKEGRILNVGYAIEQANPLQSRKPQLIATN